MYMKTEETILISTVLPVYAANKLEAKKYTFPYIV